MTDMLEEIKMKPRFLTKSRFKLALECSTKLYYTGKKEYPDKKINDRFLLALARGGFQVGELAKCYFPGGINISELDHEIALIETNKLLKEENVIIYEAAFRFENLFIRADIVVKEGKKIKLLEVKAKSIDSTIDQLTTDKGIVSKWKPYIYDVAFQKYVICNAYPELEVKSFLMLSDKSKEASVDGLNQKFLLERDEKGKTKVHILGKINNSTLGNQILIEVEVDEIISKLLTKNSFVDNPEKTFVEWIHFYADNYENDILIQKPLGGHCNQCEFKEQSTALKSGFVECWKREAKFSNEDFLKPSILNLWDFKLKDRYIKEGKYFLTELGRTDIEGKNLKNNGKLGLSRVDRQELQINKAKDSDQTVFIDKPSLKYILEGFTYPLHFIDFETTSVAIPFNAGRKPYEQIAFQFSHHIIYEDGSIEHKGQWINAERGKFPNFDFVRALKKELDGDSGTIFRYAAHENSILNAIYRQLQVSQEKDKESLCSWIKTISKSTGNSIDVWEGERNMVDLLEIVKGYYYHPKTNGSNSIKNVLPALISSSDFLKNKYSKPIYGDQIKSHNFNNHIWITYDEQGEVINPYKRLTPIFEGIDNELLDDFLLDEDTELNDGGAAMTAYAQTQFTQMSDEERKLIETALLKYCELDTLAMVMIWEEWNNLI